MNNTLEEIAEYEMQNIKTSHVPSEEENINYTESVDEWIEKIKPIDIEYSNKYGNGLDANQIDGLMHNDGFSFNFDYEIIRQASGYVTAPVFKRKEILNTTSVKTFKNLQDIKHYIKNKKYFLYMIVSYIETTGCEDTSFKVYTLDKPEMRYVFIGHILS